MFVRISQSPDVCLNLLGQVDKHKRILGLSPRSHVDGDSSDVPHAATLNESMVHGELVPHEGLLYDGLALIERCAESLDRIFATHRSLFPALHATKPSHGATHRVGMALVGVNETTLDNGCSARSFAKSNLGDDVAFVVDMTAVVAHDFIV